MSPTASILPLRFSQVGFRAGGKLLLDDISFELKDGPRTIILGPNGAGKSLGLRLAHGLIEPTSGSIEWACDDPNLVRSKQAMVFERPILLRRSAAANVDYALRVRGTPRRQRDSRVAAALAKTGLSPLAARPARVLSAGERQRLAIARAWATEPEVLFLDEPTAALDPAATRAIETLITSIADSGTKVVMTTHDLGQARRLANEILFFSDGRLLEQTPAADFFAEPATAAARAFLRGEITW